MVNIYGWCWVEFGCWCFWEVYIEVLWKNGKIVWIVGLGIGYFKLDNEYGVEVYCGVISEKQVMEVFWLVKQIC